MACPATLLACTWQQLLRLHGAQRCVLSVTCIVTATVQSIWSQTPILSTEDHPALFSHLSSRRVCEDSTEHRRHKIHVLAY